MGMKNGICAIMMLKNENRIICHEDGKKPDPPYSMLEQNLRRLNSLVEEVYIVDNASTDDSDKIYDKYKDSLIKFIQYNPDDWKFDDVRDRKILLKKAKEREMKWMLVIDGDEIYEDKADEWIHNFCCNNDHKGMFNVKFNYKNLWRGRTKYRVDMWSDSWFSRLFSLDKLELIGQPLHSYHFVFKDNNTETLGNIIESPIKCLHYGWADWDHRVAKTKRYIERDMEVTGNPYYFVKSKYLRDVDERNIILENAKTEWAEEFRSGKIGY